MRRASPSSQGDLDGLCGIYALSNFLRDLRINGQTFSSGDPHNRAREAFWLLLDVANRLSMLSPDFIVEGYSAHHLVKLWNTLAEEADLQCSAVLIRKLKRLGHKVSTGLIAECVFEECVNNALVVLHDGHWHLGTGFNGSALQISDSIRGNTRHERMSIAMLNDPDTDGLAILRDESKILKCIQIEIDRA